MIILDFITRGLLIAGLIIGLVSIIRDIKNGELRGFFGDDEGEE